MDYGHFIICFIVRKRVEDCRWEESDRLYFGDVFYKAVFVGFVYSGKFPPIYLERSGENS